jgi:hypothetical protein
MKPSTLIWSGLIVLLLGLLAMVSLWTGNGDPAACGTWGLDCVFNGVLVVPFALLLSAIPLSIGAARLPRPGLASTFWRCVAMLVSGACALVIGGLLLAVLLFATR